MTLIPATPDPSATDDADDPSNKVSCSVCVHPDRAAIEAALVKPGAIAPRLVEQFKGLVGGDLRAHYHDHLTSEFNHLVKTRRDLALQASGRLDAFEAVRRADLSPLRDDAIAQLYRAAGKAVKALVSALEDPEASHHVRIKAATAILDRVGIVPGFTLQVEPDSGKDREERLRAVLTLRESIRARVEREQTSLPPPRVVDLPALPPGR
jgi:hypothetical protein